MSSLINLKKYNYDRNQNILPGKPLCTVYKVVFPAFFWSTLVVTVHFPVGTARSKIVTSKKQVCLLRETMGNIRVRNLLCHMLTVLFPVALGKISLIEHKAMENFDIMSPEEVQ